MPSIARGQENTPDRINWFVTVNGVLQDMFEIGYRILDITGGLPGTQIFPTTPGDYEDVTTGPGHFSTGSYYAYDNGAGNGWTPGLSNPLGDHRIEWRWKTFAASAYQSGCEDFIVLNESAGSTADSYCTLTDIRDVGITVAMADDDTVIAMLAICQEFIDRACRQWFNPRHLVLSLDGNDSDTMHFGVPIITIDYIQINGAETDLEDHLFKVYNGRRYPDDRRNPRIKLVRSEDINNIYARPIIHGSKLKFRKGRQNQLVSGSFGFVEEDGTTPKLIKRAHCKLTVEKLSNPIVYDPANPNPIPTPPPIVGPLLEEETDDHRQKYAQAGGTYSSKRPGLAGFTADPEIHDIIALYKAPLGMATPAHWSYD